MILFGQIKIMGLKEGQQEGKNISMSKNDGKRIAQFLHFILLISQIFISVHLNCKNQNSMNWGTESVSHEIISDTTIPRTYICFCDKKFTTYPGIYLHLKSKHSNLFHKYKKLKITKLFRKNLDEKGSEIYRLEKLVESEPGEDDDYHQTYKENRKHERDGQNNLSLRQPIEREPKVTRKTSQPTVNRKPKQVNQPYLPLRFPQDAQRNPHHSMNGQEYPHYPPLHDHYPFGIGMPPHGHHMPNMPNMPTMPFNMPPPFFTPQQRPPMKHLLDRFLHYSNAAEKTVLRKAIRSLWIYIQQNCDSIEDPRTKDRLFISYCEEFDTLFVGPLIQEYIDILKVRKDEYEDEVDISDAEKEIDCLLRFSGWISEFGPVDFPKKQPLRSEHKNEEMEKKSNEMDKGQVRPLKSDSEVPIQEASN